MQDKKPVQKPVIKQDKKPVQKQVENTVIKSLPENENLFSFIIERTSSGIYQLISLVGKNTKVFGYARIDKLKTQKLVQKLLNQTVEGENLIMKCKYNIKFKKFIPVSKSDFADQIIDVESYVKGLNN